MLALTAAITGFGVLSSTVGIGALPMSSLPVYGVTDGATSKMSSEIEDSLQRF